MNVKAAIKDVAKAVSNVHLQGERPNVFLFSTPRSGSTWLMEVIASQPGMKPYNEPFNIRRDNVSKTGIVDAWGELMPGSSDVDRIVDYLDRLAGNRVKVMNPTPFRPFHRWVTNRVVFKIHELGHMINQVRTRCGGSVVFLLRHPIATAISRQVHPRLPHFIESPFFAEVLDARARAEIDRMYRSGDRFLHGILAWCYENYIPLVREDRSRWLVVTYEELLLNPKKSCRLLHERLDLPDLGRLLEAVGEPAMNIAMSSEDTLRIMADSDDHRKRRALVTKWGNKVDATEVSRTDEILAMFGIDAYRAGSFVAAPEWLHFEDTAAAVA